MEKETIASITTPIGEGGIGVVQVSGPKSLEIVSSVFKGKKREELRNAESKRLYYGDIHLNGTTVDEVIVSVLRKQDSFTGEDLVEVNCHGGIRAVKKTLECMVSAGAKSVHWKELAGRSFINNKIDLIREDALIEIPNAKTRLCVKTLLDQYKGALSSFLHHLMKEIENNGGSSMDRLSYIRGRLNEILKTAAFGRAVTTPQKLIITGKPNAGKSTLLNALLKEDRSITHKDPGTTRDVIDEMISVDGIPLTIIDTAGIRETSHEVERLGVLESKRHLKLADKIIIVFDSSKPAEDEDRKLIEFIDKLEIDKEDNLHKVSIFPVMNKADLPSKLNWSELVRETFEPVCHISALNGDGIATLERNLIAEFKEYTKYTPERPVIFTKRQQECLSKALQRTTLYAQSVSREGKEQGRNDYSDLLDDIRQNLLDCVGSIHFG